MQALYRWGTQFFQDKMDRACTAVHRSETFGMGGLLYTILGYLQQSQES